MKPITPKEVSKAKPIPEPVIDAFNELIAKNWDGNRSWVDQEKAKKLVIEKMELSDPRLVPIDPTYVYNQRWLDIENIYQKVGWNVEYLKPTRGKNFKPHWIFKKGN